MTVTLKIGIRNYSDYIFKDDDIISLQVKFKYNLNVNKRGKDKYTLYFLYKYNEQISQKQIKIKDNSQETIEKCITDLEKKYDIVKNIVKLSALKVSQMLEKELAYFSYVPSNEIIYEPVILPIDPYYIGFWLGDGHSASPGRFTCGGESEKGGCNDQEFILPYMEEFSKNIKLTLKQDKNSITFSINDGNERAQRINSKNYCFEEDWLEDAIKCCKELEKSKKRLSPYHNFSNNYDPCREYLNGNNYYCNCNIKKEVNIVLAKHINDEKWLSFNNVKEAAMNTDCKESTIYKSIRENIYINNWIYIQKKIKKEVLCCYNTNNTKKREDVSLIKSKQYAMKEHLKNHNIELNTAKKEWNKLSDAAKLKWKNGIDKKDICKNSKYFKCSPELTRIYKIYEKGGVEELKKYRKEKIENCNQLNYWFRKLNLINNKHIPELYLKGSVEERKKLLAGIIDSDGTCGGKYKNNCCWYIVQKKKIIIDGIEILAKSLGMFTQRNQRRCRAKKQDGSYSEYIICYNIVITPYHNWDVPVLLKRKEITSKPHKQGIGGTYLEIKNNNIPIKKNVKWTEELKIILYSVVDRFKKIKPDTPIPWSKLSEYDKRLANITFSALDTMYNKTLIKERTKYDKLIIRLNYEIPINQEFIKNYEKVKDIFENKEDFNDKLHPYLYNWFNSWKFTKEYKDQLKKNMIMELDEIRKNNIITNFKLFLTELEKHLLKENKCPLESSKLGQKLKVIKNSYKKKEGDVWNNIEKKNLWESFQTKYNDILSKNNRKLTFILTNNELNEKKFNTQNEVCKFLKTDKTTIKKYRNSSNYFKGYLIKTV